MKDLDWERNSLFVTQFPPYDKFSGQNAMIRNKLVCAMSQTIVVIASGTERDNEGRMSGTFDAGKSALKMNIPVFVLSPKIFKITPQGNIDLIKLGGIEFSNGNDIVNYLSEYRREPVLVHESQEIYHKNATNIMDGKIKKIKKSKKKKSSTTNEQTSLDF